MTTKAEIAKQMELSANELYTSLVKQCDEWKTYLKTLLTGSLESYRGLVDEVRLQVAQITPDGEQACIRATYSMPDALVDFARSAEAPPDFTAALLEGGIDLDVVPTIQPVQAS